mmetsp:Transcript_2429/g.5665  ORF Transcript_2429/g.5665 Transcript_2429/m.5665 type:complete len:232 (-) Transcript_2429:31-726(-)
MQCNYRALLFWRIVTWPRKSFPLAVLGKLSLATNQVLGILYEARPRSLRNCLKREAFSSSITPKGAAPPNPMPPVPWPWSELALALAQMPWEKATTQHARCPSRLSGRPKTMHSATPSHLATSISTSEGYTISDPLRIASPFLPHKCTPPCPSSQPKSPVANQPLSATLSTTLSSSAPFFLEVARGKSSCWLKSQSKIRPSHPMLKRFRHMSPSTAPGLKLSKSRFMYSSS